MAGVGITVEQLNAGRRIHEGVVDELLAEHCAHRHHAVGQALRSGHHVRLDIKVVGSEWRGQATEAGDHFIEDQQDAVLGAQFTQALQITLRRYQHAGRAGHRLDDDGGDGRCIMQRNDAFQFIGQFAAVFRFAARVSILFQVVRMRQVVHARQHHAIRLAVAGDTTDRDAAEADAVIAAFAADQPGAARFTARLVIGQRDLQRGIHRFGTGVGVEHMAVAMVGVLHQFFGQIKCGRVAHLEGRCEVQLADHLAHGGDDLRLRVAAGHAPQAGGAVQDAVAVNVLVVHALRRHQQPRMGLEVAVVGKWHPERCHRFRS